MRAVALAGFAESTRRGIYSTQVDEIWSLNMVLSSPAMREVFPLPRLDRLFELHPVGLLLHPQYSPSQPAGKHWQWLTETEHSYPVYMLDECSEVHGSVRYPVEEILDRFGENLTHDGQEDGSYLTSTFCFMLALALYEGFQFIEVYGFEMGSETEYAYQKPAAEHWLGIANGLGVKVWLHKRSGLLRGKLYGFEAGEMVSRQMLDGYRSGYTRDRQRMMGEFNVLNASYVEKRKAGVDDVALMERGRALLNKIVGYDYVLQFVDKLLGECDLKEMPRDFVDRLKLEGLKE